MKALPLAVHEGYSNIFADNNERVHALTFFPHNLFDGASDMHAPSRHHHVGRFCTEGKVHVLDIIRKNIFFSFINLFYRIIDQLYHIIDRIYGKKGL